MDKQTYDNFRKVFTGTNILYSYAMLLASDYDFLTSILRAKLRTTNPLLRISMETPGHPKCIEGNYYAQLSINPELDKELRSEISICVMMWVEDMQENEIDIQVESNLGIDNTLMIRFANHKDLYDILGTPKLIGKKWLPEHEAVVPTLLKSYFLAYNNLINIPSSESSELEILSHLTPTQINTEFTQHLHSVEHAGFIEALGENFIDQLFPDEIDVTKLESLTIPQKAAIGIDDYESRLRDCFAESIDGKIPDQILQVLSTDLLEHFLATECKPTLTSMSVKLGVEVLSTHLAQLSFLSQDADIFNYQNAIRFVADNSDHNVNIENVIYLFTKLILGNLAEPGFTSKIEQAKFKKCTSFELLVWMTHSNPHFDLDHFIENINSPQELEQALLSFYEDLPSGEEAEVEVEAEVEAEPSIDIPEPSELTRILIQEAALMGVIGKDSYDLTEIDIDTLYADLYLTKDRLVTEPRLFYIDALLQKDDRLYSSICSMTAIELYLDHAISKAEGFQFVVQKEGADLKRLINLRLRVHLLEMHNVSPKVLALSTDAEVETLHDIYFHV